MAQLYQQEFKTQERAKYEHIRQAKEKALEEQRISEENKRRAEADKAVSIYQGSGGTAWMTW